MKRPSKIALTIKDVLFAFGIVAAVMFFGTLLVSLPARAFMQRYVKLRPGMTVAGVHKLLGRPPDYVCRFESGQIAYYTRGGPFDDRPAARRLPTGKTTYYYRWGWTSTDRTERPLPAVAARQSDIPYLYGNAQLLFDRNGTLAAYTLGGETTQIVTTVGIFHGSEMRGGLTGETLHKLLTQ